MTPRLRCIAALLDAIQRMLAAIKAINNDDYATAETELLAVHEGIATAAAELRSAA